MPPKAPPAPAASTPASSSPAVENHVPIEVPKAATAAVHELDEAGAPAIDASSQQVDEQREADDHEAETVAVGAVAHVVRRAFHAFYCETPSPLPAPTDPPAAVKDESNATDSAATAIAGGQEDAAALQESEESLHTPANAYVQLGEARKAQIESARQHKRAEATALLRFLDERHRAADNADEAIAQGLSDKGLVIKAQIPIGPTNLRLDAAEVARFGSFAADLVHATQLVSEFHSRRRERSGNGPDALARKRAAAPGIVPEPTDSSAVRTQSTLAMHERRIEAVKMHHSITTSSSNKTGTGNGSTDTTGSRSAMTTSQGAHDATDSEPLHVASGEPTDSSAGSSTAKKRPTKDDATMNAGELRKNLAILDRMQRKLAFLRNPRFAPGDSDRFATVGADSSDHDAAGTPSCFVVVPSPVEFTDYDVGGVYEQLVYVRNTSRLSRRLRVLPPATLYFSIDEIAFPDPSGLVAPGMHVQLRLRFAPDSRADYKDAMRIAHECAGGPGGASGAAAFTIPLAARRVPPELSIPLVLRAQNTLVGAYSVTPLVCRNSGGKARFWLLTEDAWAMYEASSGAAAAQFLREQSERSGVAPAPVGQLTVGAFTLSPNEMELATGESVTLQLQYVPSCVGEQRGKFIMVCDNCLVRVFQFAGRGCQVDVAITSVNDKQIDASIGHMGALDHVVFEPVAVNAIAQQRVVVTNDTPIALEYDWRMTSGSDSGGDPPYQISPSTGVIALNAALEFAVTFAPAQARLHQWRAELCVNGIPQCSMPGPEQRARLANAFQSLQTSLANVKLESVPALSVRLDGTGILGRFSIAPPYWNFCGSDPGQQSFLEKHVTYSTRVELRNSTSAPVAFEIDIANVAQRHARAAASSAWVHASGTNDDCPTFEISARPLTGELPPNAHVAIEFSFTPHCVGVFALAVPVCIPTTTTATSGQRPRTRDATFVRWLLLEGYVARGDVEIVSPEVDFGLVLVGTSVDATLTLRNRAPVPADWRLLHVEAVASHQQQQPQLTGGGNSVVSRRSVCSNASSGGTDTSRSSLLFTARDTLPRATVTFAPETGTLAPDETRVIRVCCIAGSLPERLRASFRCQLSAERSFSGGATLSQRDVSVSARAEIQAPNVFLSPPKLTLGTTYLGVAVRRVLELVNVSNLEASFKFVEPQGLSKAYVVAFAPASGTLRSKETLAVTLTYTPKQAGKTTVLLACTVRGLPAPLGVEVVTNQKGLVLSYELLQAAAATLRQSVLPPSPKQMALERGLSVADSDLEPDTNLPSAVPRLHFGDAIPLGQRSVVHVLIRNFSDIEAVIDLEAKRFPASKSSSLEASLSSSSVSASRSNNNSHDSANSSSLASPKSSVLASPLSKTSRSSHTSSSSTTTLHRTKNSQSHATATRKKLLIGDAHEQPSRFQSDNGRDYLRQCAEDAEDRDVLREGHGVAFQPRPSRVCIPPWEQRVVAVVCYNNMPGSYTDDIVSRAAGSPPVFLHAQATVVGTPLTLDRNCVGLFYPSTQRQRQQQQQQPTFHFGLHCTKAPPLTRAIRVVNRGPKQARLKWKLAETGRENQLVSVSLSVDVGCHVQLRIVVCQPEDRAFPFAVAPEQAMIPPFATVSFQVTYTPSDTVDAARVLLLADAHWYDIVTTDKEPTSPEVLDDTHGASSDATDSRCEAPSSASHPMTATAAGKAIAAVRAANSLYRRIPAPGQAGLSSTASHVSAKCLRVLLAADVVEPELFLDRSRTPALLATVPPPLRHTASLYHIKFTTWSTVVASPNAAAHAFHRQELSFVNRLSTRVTFRLESVGPFAVVRADSLAPKHPLSSADLPPAHRRAQGEAFLFTLPPHMAVRVDLRFDPTRIGSAVAPALTASGRATGVVPQPPPRLSAHVAGQLLIKFTNRSVQTVALGTDILWPRVVVSPSVYFFGHVHVSQSRAVVLRVANPTVVPAAFAVAHVPLPTPVSKAQQHEFARHHAHYADDPSVFTFSATTGVVAGPTTSLQSAGGALPAATSTRDLGPHPLVGAPVGLTVTFRAPAAKTRFRSRFRFVVAHGVDFEVVLEGEGHLEERAVEDQGRSLVRTRALEHSAQILTRVLQ
ncbi:hypothetical protein PybrP1_012054 [[Pythium] brassicae (nom. inval.)]|nr:hypothetical protein PybrP1_012054 [[Pythium] brassicae (nom. inval.)]